VIIFSDEKTWTVDPVRNRRNDRYLAIGEVDETLRTHTTTKHPSSAMCLGFVASNGLAPPLIWFPVGYRLTAADYIAVLEEKFLPWVRDTFPDGNVVLQQDGAPAHTANRTQNFLEDNIAFWSKEMWPPYSPDVNPLDYAFWPHVQSKACTVRHPNLDTMKATVDEHWASMDQAYIVATCQAFRKRLAAVIAADGGYIE
jgi:hypothetical protein